MLRSWSEIDIKAPAYYDKIIALCKENNKFGGNITFIVVDHCLQTFVSHVNSLEKLGKIAGIILKSSSQIKEVKEHAMKLKKILSVTKEELKKSGVAIRIILANTSAEDKLVILDHGGYFSPALKEMMEHKDVSKRLIGIAEVTENGHQRLAEALKRTPVPNLSIAHSNIKALEDLKTGDAICDATNTILYSVHCSLNSLQNACVIGYGKIGRNIANSCKSKGIRKITVIETDAVRASFARAEGHAVVMGEDANDKANALQQAQVLFSATGSKALTSRDVANLANRSSRGQFASVLFIVSCTSPDDEFDKSFFTELQITSKNSEKNRTEHEEKFHLSPYELPGNRNIYILNKGKAVNFLFGGTPGVEICQVWAAVLYTAAKLAAEKVESSTNVELLTGQEEAAICKVTEEVFFGNRPSDNGVSKSAAKTTPITPAPHRRAHSPSTSFLTRSDFWKSPKVTTPLPQLNPLSTSTVEFKLQSTL